MSQATAERVVRVGVFQTTGEASRAIQDLLAAGFAHDQISVICSDKIKEDFFAEFKDPKLPQRMIPPAAAVGSSVGALLAGLATVTGLVLTGGIGILAVGPIVVSLGTGAVVGGFIGAMMTRGVTKEAAEYYEQSVVQGRILVAVEDESSSRLREVERIFTAAGAVPVPLFND